MITKIPLLIVLIILTVAKPVNLTAQEFNAYEKEFPQGLTLEYGIGNYAVTDEYISKEKYTGTLPYYKLSWSSQHSGYIYQISMQYSYSSSIKNYNVSTDINQFRLNQGFNYLLSDFTLFNNNASIYLGPTMELLFFFNRQNIAVSGFDYAQSMAFLISGGISSRIFYEIGSYIYLEGSLNLSMLSLGFRMVDLEEDDQSPVKILTFLSGTDFGFKIGPRYYIKENLSLSAAYYFQLIRISSWEPLRSASDNITLSVTYGF